MGKSDLRSELRRGLRADFAGSAAGVVSLRAVFEVSALSAVSTAGRRCEDFCCEGDLGDLGVRREAKAERPRLMLCTGRTFPSAFASLMIAGVRTCRGGHSADKTRLHAGRRLFTRREETSREG